MNVGYRRIAARVSGAEANLRLGWKLWWIGLECEAPGRRPRKLIRRWKDDRLQSVAARTAGTPTVLAVYPDLETAMRLKPVTLGVLALACLIAPDSISLAGGGDSGGNCYAVHTDADGRPYEVPTPGNKIYVTGPSNWIDKDHICDSWNPKYGPRPKQ